MAARRLIFVMIVMLMLSSFAAALVPVRDDGEESSSTTTAAALESPASGRLIEAHLDASAKETKTIRIELGEQLTLTVAADKAGEVSIATLGELEDVEPGTPALFDLLPFEEGTHDVRLVESGRLLGQFVVEGAPKKEKQKHGGNGEQSEGAPTTSA